MKRCVLGASPNAREFMERMSTGPVEEQNLSPKVQENRVRENRKKIATYGHSASRPASRPNTNRYRLTLYM